MGLFIGFVVWALSFYSSFFTGVADISSFADITNGRILENLTIDSYEVPIRYNSSNMTSNTVLHFDFVWPEDTQNTTKIFSGTTEITCSILNNVIYFETDLTNLTYNYFKMTFSKKNVTANCANFAPAHNRTQIVPWAMQKKSLISQSIINMMTNLTYADYKSQLGITRDFRIEINESGTETNYGLPLPNNRNVYSRETTTRLEETNSEVDITVMVW